MLLKMLMKPSQQLTIGNSLFLLLFCNAATVTICSSFELTATGDTAGYTRVTRVLYMQAKCVNF